MNEKDWRCLYILGEALILKRTADRLNYRNQAKYLYDRIKAKINSVKTEAINTIILDLCRIIEDDIKEREKCLIH